MNTVSFIGMGGLFVILAGAFLVVVCWVIVNFVKSLAWSWEYGNWQERVGAATVVVAIIFLCLWVLGGLL